MSWSPNNNRFNEEHLPGNMRRNMATNIVLSSKIQLTQTLFRDIG